VLLPASVNAVSMGMAVFYVFPASELALPEPPTLEQSHQFLAGPAPPLPNSWQFNHRTALPPRAPSIPA
jgi:hypothetical protein